MNCNHRWASLTRTNEKRYFSYETFLLKKRGIRRGGWRSPTSVDADADVDIESSVLQIILDVIAAKHYPALFDDDDDDDDNDDGDDANTTRR